jgi:hypothetical protein
MDLKEMGWRCELDYSASVQEQVGGSREHGDEPLDSINCREILD